MLIELSKQQISDMTECEAMAEQGKDKECFGCSLNKCILDLRYSSKAAAAPEMYEALIQAFGALKTDAMVNDNGVFYGTTIEALTAIKAALAKAEGK